MICSCHVPYLLTASGAKLYFMFWIAFLCLTLPWFYDYDSDLLILFVNVCFCKYFEYINIHCLRCLFSYLFISCVYDWSSSPTGKQSQSHVIAGATSGMSNITRWRINSCRSFPWSTDNVILGCHGVLWIYIYISRLFYFSVCLSLIVVDSTGWEDTSSNCCIICIFSNEIYILLPLKKSGFHP